MAAIKVLIISYEEEFCYTMVDIFQQSSIYEYEVDCVEDNESVEDVFSDAQYDIVFVNVDAASDRSADWVELLSKLGLNVPLITIISKEHNTVEYREKISELGVDDYLVKEEFTIDCIEKAIKYSFERQGSEEYMLELNAKNRKLFSLISDTFHASILAIDSIKDILESENTSTDEQILAINNLVEQIPRNNNIVDNIEIWEHYENGELAVSLEVVNIKELVEEILTTFKDYTDFKEIKLISSVRKDVLVKSDRNIINFVLGNLVKNAIKYTQKGGHVFVDCQLNMDSTVLSVKDSGVGMTEEQVSAIMQRNAFVNTPGTLGENGSGLGIELSIDFIDLIGGEFWLESEQSKGTAFYFAIP